MYQLASWFDICKRYSVKALRKASTKMQTQIARLVPGNGPAPKRLVVKRRVVKVGKALDLVMMSDQDSRNVIQ
jgi:hypothetical protein